LIGKIEPSQYATRKKTLEKVTSALSNHIGV